MDGSINQDEYKELVMPLPWEILDASCGFSFDIGGSVVKAVYIHKDDWKESKERKTANAVIRLISFAREKAAETFPYVQERMRDVQKARDEDRSLAYTTGVGGSQLLNEIRLAMGVKTINIAETDAFVQCFLYLLKQKTMEELVYPIDENAVKILRVRMQGFAEVFKQRKLHETTAMAFPDMKPFKLAIEENIQPNSRFIHDPDIFPCLVIICGSAGLAVKVYEDGTYQMLDQLTRCGRMFLGLGCALTGAKTFEELITLAEKGNGKNVHMSMSDLHQQIPREDESTYSALGRSKEDTETFDFPLFHFGKVVGEERDSVKPEDWANALLSAMASDLAQFAYHNALLYPTKYIFFCGNYVSHPLMQYFTTVEYGQRDILQACMTKQNKSRHLFFLKNGGYYGALGAFLNYHLKYTDHFAEMAKKATEHLQEDSQTR